MMNQEKAEELMLEEFQERQKEPFNVWKEENLSTLESDFIKTFPPEEQPIDDDGPDFIDSYCDDFDKYCMKVYEDLEVY